MFDDMIDDKKKKAWRLRQIHGKLKDKPTSSPASPPSAPAPPPNTMRTYVAKFEIKWDGSLGPNWMNKHNLALCLTTTAFCGRGTIISIKETK